MTCTLGVFRKIDHWDRAVRQHQVEIGVEVESHPGGAPAR